MSPAAWFLPLVAPVCLYVAWADAAHKKIPNVALRLIFFKIKVEGPTRENFIRIFDLIVAQKGLEVCPEAMRNLLDARYPEIDHVYASYPPVYLVVQILAICQRCGPISSTAPEPTCSPGARPSPAEASAHRGGDGPG